jgi:hypothetical protein
MALPHNLAAVFVGAVAGAAALIGCGSLSPQTEAAHKIADALPGVLGHARHYDVRVEGDSLALTRGRARRVVVHGQDVQIARDVTLDTLDFTAIDVSFDTKAKHLRHVGRVEFTGTVGQAHLNQYLAQSGTNPGLVVILREHDMQARLPISAGPVHTHVTVNGTASPTTVGGSQVSFTADRAKLGFLPVPAFLVNKALDQVNPVVDLSHFKVPVALQSTDVEHHALTLRGTADITALTSH